MAESRSVVITGASGGIGAALATELAGRGHKLTLAARRPDALRAVVERIYESAIGVVADVTVRDEVELVRDRAIGRWGVIDVWVNNAGQGINRPTLELTDEDLDRVLRANLYSSLYGMQAIAPYFISRGTGHIVNISSNLSKAPYARFRSIYSASKAALNSLSTNVREDLREVAPGVRVSVVLPGPVTTDFARNAIHAPNDASPSKAAVSPQGPGEVAAVIADLIEDPEPAAELFTSAELASIARRYAEENAGSAPRR